MLVLELIFLMFNMSSIIICFCLFNSLTVNEQEMVNIWPLMKDLGVIEQQYLKEGNFFPEIIETFFFLLLDKE